MYRKKQTFLCCFILLIVLLLPHSLMADLAEKKQNSPMLATNWLPSIDVNGWWLSEKLDGVRGCWTGKEMLSRSGKKIKIPEWFTKNFPPFPLDGELWIGRGRFSEVISIVRTKKAGKEWEKVAYYIFDLPENGVVFEKGIDIAKKWFEKNPSPYVKIIEQKLCINRLYLMNELKRVEDLQGEGLMLRRPGSVYKKGRSRDILKVKTFHDAEALVVGHIQGSGKNSHRMGSIRVELLNGVRFLIGTGFTDSERENPPPIGSIITFKYKEINKSGIPRFASFLRVKQSF